MAKHNITGKEGEEIAVKFLEKIGYKVIERNWQFKKAELDIVARKGDRLVVAEVKTRATNAFGEPEVFVDVKKQRNIIRAANAYVIEKSIDMEVRFDIISVIHNGSETAVTHIEDAFYPLV
jgi:putative endonuclease